MSWFCENFHLNENNEWITLNGTKIPLNLVKLDQIEFKPNWMEISIQPNYEKAHGVQSC